MQTENRAFRVACGGERVQCVNVCRIGGKNPSFDMKYCACVLIAFLAGTISLAVDYIYAATGVKSKNF